MEEGLLISGALFLIMLSLTRIPALHYIDVSHSI